MANNNQPEDKEINMNEENVKLAKIKKSCHAGKIVSVILCIVAIVGCVSAMIGGIAIVSMGSKFDTEINRLIEEGKINSEGDAIGKVRAIDINIGSVDNLHSDIPALQKAIDDHPYAVKYSMICFAAAATCAIAAILMKLVSSVFGLIQKEDSPFTAKVIRRVTIALGAVTVVLFFTSGMAFGLLGALVTWVVYTVMDYGKTLQIQSDETL